MTPLSNPHFPPLPRPQALVEASTAPATSASALALARLVALTDVAFHFKRLRLYELPSWAAALEAVAAEWQPQLLAQLPAALSGLPVVRSVVHLKRGLSALLLAPLRPAPLRGLQLGGKAFAHSVAVEGRGLTERMISVSRHVANGVDAMQRQGKRGGYL